MKGTTLARHWTFDLPMTAPLSLNGREHWRVKAKKVAQVRKDACLSARAAHIPHCSRISVELHYAPRDMRRRDPLNLVATLKPVEDGLVDAGVVPDDTPQYVLPTMPVVDAPIHGKHGRIYVVIREIDNE
jgi:crossover junction endodeoxyribonuclease RusA